jgi:hypothetical protein
MNPIISVGDKIEIPLYRPGVQFEVKENTFRKVLLSGKIGGDHPTLVEISPSILSELGFNYYRG